MIKPICKVYFEGALKERPHADQPPNEMDVVAWSNSRRKENEKKKRTIHSLEWVAAKRTLSSNSTTVERNR
jgi:hypothetical protein